LFKLQKISGFIQPPASSFQHQASRVEVQMSVTTKILLIFTGIALIFSLGTVDTAGFDGRDSVGALLDGWRGRFRLEPREVYRAAPVVANENEASRSELLPPSTPEPPEPPPAVKGVYLTAWKAGDRQFVERLLDMMGQTGLNSLVIDVKNDTGMVGYPSGVPLAQTVGAGGSCYRPEQLLERLATCRIYPIARIVVFKDPLLATQRPDLAVRDSRGGLWRDRRGMFWVDPHNQTVWEYNVALAQEAVRLGFKEIQFDYVRFTSDGAIRNCRYPGMDGRPRSIVIRDFLAYAAGKLRGTGARLSADVFGLTCSAEGELGIGQVFEMIAAEVDVICPMVYPSHYAKGTYQLANPDLKPYETVYRSLTDARRKLEISGNPSVIIRPWLQDFSLGSVYTKTQLQAQVRAVCDAGLTEWIFWNPHNHYEVSKYRFDIE
jgi:hypothetical protein